MNLLLDTHLLLWAAGEPDRLSAEAQQLIGNPANELFFSAASLWEVTIKSGSYRDYFQIDPTELRHGLLENGYRELSILGDHVLAAKTLPPIHRDPFDRILVAQATVEKIRLLTTDRTVAQYPGPIQQV
ncbi:type II toxin-antitoxin system VapC family toxin [Granulicella sp. WH15]|uniref:type II toxin-antitoxin system VapC family toxin n=1 Tax=Granulicella sp. WH15 TaxID=2602070 RepID=UPI00136796A3|nr:type II toxin-antitoxin system VapC family toxin [Granulicella sp. WH15]QHN02867.1 type II toxin-antitoxin system VapC family toxin [Granulicella sp. WH15]